MSTSIVVADDHVLFRQGLVSLLHDNSDLDVVGEAGDGEEAIRLVESLNPEVVVIDIEMPKLGGVEAARRIRVASKEIRIVALSMYSDTHHVQRMLEAGANAYVLKNEAIDDLLLAIDAVQRGARFVSAAVAQGVSHAPQSREPIREIALSAREKEVLRLLAEGMRTKEIAESLGISAKTVETYRGRVMLKLGIDNLPGLVKYAIRAGITST